MSRLLSGLATTRGIGRRPHGGGAYDLTRSIGQLAWRNRWQRAKPPFQIVREDQSSPAAFVGLEFATPDRFIQGRASDMHERADIFDGENHDRNTHHRCLLWPESVARQPHAEPSACARHLFI